MKYIRIILFLFYISNTANAQLATRIFNFSDKEIGINQQNIPSGVTLLFFNSDSLLLSGFYCPRCTAIAFNDTLHLNNVVSVNLKWALEAEMEINQIIKHELVHFQQRQRYTSLKAYLQELNRQQCLPYRQRPWEIEAYEQQNHVTNYVSPGPSKPAIPVKILFPSY